MKLKVPIYDSFSLSLVYSPGVGESCLEINKHYDDVYRYTNIGKLFACDHVCNNLFVCLILGNTLAIVTDCSDYHKFSDPKWHMDAAIP